MHMSKATVKRHPTSEEEAWVVEGEQADGVPHRAEFYGRNAVARAVIHASVNFRDHVVIDSKG